MAELPRTHPLEAWTAAFAALPDGVRIEVDPYVATAAVRTADPGASGLPVEPNTWLPAGDGRAVWLGPDEWLLTSPAETPEALEARLRAELVPAGGSATNVSAQRITLRLRGSRVRDVLAKGCSLDLHPAVPTPGRSAQTMLAHAAVVLLALGEDDYLVLVRSSFAGYLADWLLDAALEFAPA